MKVLGILVFTLCMLHGSNASCSYNDIMGAWTFHESQRVLETYRDCENIPEDFYEEHFTLDYPNIVRDGRGNLGTWTLVGILGFEVTMNGRSYYASYFSCGKTFTGWARDTTIRNWSCYHATKDGQNADRAMPVIPFKPIPEKNFENDHLLVREINSLKTSWKAKAYPEFEKYTLEEMFLRQGGKMGLYDLPDTVPATKSPKDASVYLPENFDWRNVHGTNYVTAVRDQLGCGSSYAFVSTAAVESRLRIMSNNKREIDLSPQDVIDCSPLGYGCGGGHNVLTAGRYAQDYGFIPEVFNQYTARDKPCHRDNFWTRTYVSSYGYVGGYYGGASELEMMEALVLNGPLPATMKTYPEFKYYSGGVYRHVFEEGERDFGFDPYVSVNHNLLITGYGVDKATGDKYWIAKNSWGKDWGENGYVRILRGYSECGIESVPLDMAVILN